MTTLHNALREELKPGTPVFFSDDPSTQPTPATVVQAPEWHNARLTAGYYGVTLELDVRGKRHQLHTEVSNVYVPVVG